MSSQSDQQRVSVKVDRKVWQEAGEYAKKIGMTKSQFVVYSLNKLLGERIATIFDKDKLITQEEKDFLSELLQTPPQTSTKED